MPRRAWTFFDPVKQIDLMHPLYGAEDPGRAGRIFSAEPSSLGKQGAKDILGGLLGGDGDGAPRGPVPQPDDGIGVGAGCRPQTVAWLLYDVFDEVRARLSARVAVSLVWYLHVAIQRCFDQTSSVTVELVTDVVACLERLGAALAHDRSFLEAGRARCRARGSEPMTRVAE
jgi:hypothetical protein